MKRIVCLFVLAIAVALVPAMADVAYYQAPEDNNNQIGFVYGGGPAGVGNTITLAGSGLLQTVDLFGYAGGGSKPIEVDLYSGTNPNTGTLLGSEQVTPTGNGYTTEVFNFGGLAVPQTLTYIVSIVGNSGSYDDSFVNWQQFTGAAGSPTIGTSADMWYGSPGSYVVDNSYAVATGASTNTLGVQFNVSVPEPGVVSLLFTMLAGVGGLAGVLRKKLT